MSLLWRVKRTNGIALWICCAARPPLSLSLCPSPFPLFISLSVSPSLFFHPKPPWFSLRTCAVFTRAIPLIPFLPLLSRSLHLQRPVLSTSFYFSAVIWGLPPTRSVTPRACSDHLNSFLSSNLSIVQLESLSHIFSVFVAQTTVKWASFKQRSFHSQPDDAHGLDMLLTIGQLLSLVQCF